MRLRVITPKEVCVDRKVTRLVAEAPDGFFGIRPHHIGFVTQLVPGVLVFEPEEGGIDRFVAINSGTLVKCGEDVNVAVRGAIEGTDLARLRERVETEFRQQEEDEREARSALTRLEATMIRRFRDLEKVDR
ncbi:ATP synthase epsilon chain (plasmid) [Pseudoseohaeicola sp. NH-UV-7]|uniref:F0F1 ATP synthase subunit epsilon n=1 Tax=unclassified Sulfitobacter TaxID=196795 RepID=UPI000E0B6A63|nr:F0F1 ATP synthase subunit epsilon [Sulfitobacter sp. JL08]AXI53574.1 F0F1 ATP synthase subunit epsilon [Sulfitobacter sp. JL08]